MTSKQQVLEQLRIQVSRTIDSASVIDIIIKRNSRLTIKQIEEETETWKRQADNDEYHKRIQEFYITVEGNKYRETIENKIDDFRQKIKTLETTTYNNLTEKLQGIIPIWKDVKIYFINEYYIDIYLSKNKKITIYSHKMENGEYRYTVNANSFDFELFSTPENHSFFNNLNAILQNTSGMRQFIDIYVHFCEQRPAFIDKINTLRYQLANPNI